MTPLRLALLGLSPADARGLARALRTQPPGRRVLVAVGPGAVVLTCAAWLAARLEATC